VLQDILLSENTACRELPPAKSKAICQYLRQYYRLPLCGGAALTPTFATPDPGNFHPSHPTTTFLAKISPKPSMTPLTNGMRQLMAKADSSAPTLVRVGMLESNIAIVADGGGGAVG